MAYPTIRNGVNEQKELEAFLKTKVVVVLSKWNLNNTFGLHVCIKMGL